MKCGTAWRACHSTITTEHGFAGRVPVSDEDQQAWWLNETWDRVANSFHQGVAGLVIMEWVDEWWKGDIADVRNNGCPNSGTSHITLTHRRLCKLKRYYSVPFVRVQVEVTER